MARNNAITVIDFGSSTINVVIAERGVNNTFNIYGKCEVEYSGYLDGEFLNVDELYHIVGHAMEDAERQSGIKSTEVFVGVPGEFTSVVLKQPSLSFDNKLKITDSEVEELFELGDVFKNHPEFLLINRSPIFYLTDDGRYLIDPRNVKSKTLTGQLSYVLAKRTFTDVVSEVFLRYGIKRIEFVSSCLAESIYLIDAYSRDRYAVLLDIGYTTTSVMVIRGEGLLYLKSFPMGGAHITADLYECFEVPFAIAEELKRKISLTFAVTEKDKYEVIQRDKTYTFDAGKAHKIVEARIDEIAILIQKCLKACNVEFPSYINFKLTGGGISYMRGSKEYLGRAIGKNVDLTKNSIPQLDFPHLSSTYAVLDIALKQKKTKNLFGNLFK